jgi:hypothetical protein
LTAPAFSQLTQRRACVRHLHASQLRLQQTLFCQRSHGTGGCDLGQKVMRIKTLAFERHKQITALQGSAVGVYTLNANMRVAMHLLTKAASVAS